VRTHLVVAIAGLLSLMSLDARPVAAQNTHQDPLGRFAIDLPTGFKLINEQLDRVYVFERSGVRIVLFVATDVADRDAVWASAIESFTGQTVPVPPPEVVQDMEVNGNPARLAQFTFPVESGGKTVELAGKIGAVMLEGTETGLAFMAMFSTNLVKQLGEPMVQAFYSIRLPGAPMTGATAPVAATLPGQAAPGQVIEVPTAAAPTTFEHPLAVLSIPVGWTATAGEGAKIADISHSSYPTLHVIGLEKNKFGKNRDQVLEALVQGLQSEVPSFSQTKAPYEVPLEGGGSALVAEYEGAIVAAGQSLPHAGLVAAVKDDRRGVGFMWIATPEAWDKALDQVLAMVKSLR
jgi:hypothetical protein